MLTQMTTHSLIGSRDFDFFYGKWVGHNRKLLKRLQGCTDWEEFEATVNCVPVLDGLGNIDELRREPDQPPLGMAVRFYDLNTELWSIYWVSTRDGILQPPVVGSFANGTGIFEGEDVWEGTPIISRFSWFHTNTPHPRWEQAFSTDGGETWETNWITTFTRIGD